MYFAMSRSSYSLKQKKPIKNFIGFFCLVLAMFASLFYMDSADGVSGSSIV